MNYHIKNRISHFLIGHVFEKNGYFSAPSKNLAIIFSMTDCPQDCMNFEHAGYKIRIVLLSANPFSKDIFVNITAPTYRQTPSFYKGLLDLPCI